MKKRIEYKEDKCSACGEMRVLVLRYITVGQAKRVKLPGGGYYQLCLECDERIGVGRKERRIGQGF